MHPIGSQLHAHQRMLRVDEAPWGWGLVASVSHCALRSLPRCCSCGFPTTAAQKQSLEVLLGLLHVVPGVLQQGLPKAFQRHSPSIFKGLLCQCSPSFHSQPLPQGCGHLTRAAGGSAPKWGTWAPCPSKPAATPGEDMAQGQ